ncbi:CDP-alcohol phosphatidyltransferase family protein, partial [Arthrospira sp. O9.13F]
MSDTVYEKTSELPENSIVSPQSPLDKILQFFTLKIAKVLINVSWITPNGITWTSLLI